SNNDYDWLGNGIYFWENNPARALKFAQDAVSQKHLSRGEVRIPFVIGAILDLGHCLNLLDSIYLKELKTTYQIMKSPGFPLPTNEYLEDSGYFLKRNLDCAVIEALHSFKKKGKEKAFDSVKGVFVEGDELYPMAGFREKNHIQLCIRNPNCIKGYFHPQILSDEYPSP
ncbi:MAG: hypothetical protein GY940_47055, partial [bacterium]|nr:hypothetical protein [bacterium]